MALLGRIGIILFAFLVASTVAGVVITIALVGPEWSAARGEPVLVFGFWVLVLLTAGFSGAVAIVPLFLLVVVSEAFRLRSILLYALYGAVVMPVGYLWSGLAGRIDPDTAQLPIGHETTIAIAAGIVLGAVYWLIAGRNSGAWRGAP